MKWPENLIAEAIEEYPEDNVFHQDLERESGEWNKRVLNYLFKNSKFSMTSGEIIQTFEAGEEKDVLEAAKNTNRRFQLYKKFDEFHMSY